MDSWNAVIVEWPWSSEWARDQRAVQLVVPAVVEEAVEVEELQKRPIQSFGKTVGLDLRDDRCKQRSDTLKKGRWGNGDFGRGRGERVAGEMLEKGVPRRWHMVLRSWQGPKSLDAQKGLNFGGRKREISINIYAGRANGGYWITGRR
jgi:hypothetical protein